MYYGYDILQQMNSNNLLRLCVLKQKSSFVCLCWGFTAQSTEWGHVERGQFT